MKKKEQQKSRDFDRDFDQGKVSIDFSQGVVTQGLSKMVKLPPMEIPSWLAIEIEKISKHQGNSRAAVIRQLLATAVEGIQKFAKVS